MLNLCVGFFHFLVSLVQAFPSMVYEKDSLNLKLNFFFWMAILHKINTRGVLARRGSIIESDEATCFVRLLAEEIVDRLLIRTSTPEVFWFKMLRRTR